MTHNVVDFVVAEPIETRRYLTSKYELRPDRPAPWLQKVALWVLRKLGAYAIEYTTTYKRYRIDTRSVIEAIYKQRNSLLQQYAAYGERLLIGAEDFANLMGETTPFNQAISFNLEYRNPTVCGMKATIIPWMRGYLVVPKGTID